MKINFKKIKYSKSEIDRINRYFLEKNTYELNRISYSRMSIQFLDDFLVESEVSIFQLLGALIKFTHEVKADNAAVLFLTESPPFIFTSPGVDGDIKLTFGIHGATCEKIEKKLLLSIIEDATFICRSMIREIIPYFEDDHLPSLGISIN